MTDDLENALQRSLENGRKHVAVLIEAVFRDRHERALERAVFRRECQRFHAGIHPQFPTGKDEVYGARRA